MNLKKAISLNWEDVSKYRNELYGFSILWIMIFHGWAMLKLNYSMGMKFLEPLHELISYGNMGCEIFLFCSGVCLYFSFCKNQNLLRFISKRLSRVFWPVAIITGWYWLWLCVSQEVKFAAFFSKMTMLDFWVSGNQQIWFVAFIVICYFLYPYIYSFLYESKWANRSIRFLSLLVLVIITTLSVKEMYPDVYKKVEIGVTRFPIFLIGCYCGKFVYEKKGMPKWTWILVLLTNIIVFHTLHIDVLHGVWRRWFYLFGGLSVTYTVIMFLKLFDIKWIRKFLCFFGGISLNLYVAHILAIMLYRTTAFYDNCRILHYIVVMILCVIVGWITEKIIGLLSKQKKRV